MDGVYEELEEAKLKVEKLQSDYLRKVEQYQGLKKMYDEQVMELRQVTIKADNQSQEFIETTGELASVKELCERLTSDLNHRELTLKQLGAANDVLRSEFNVKLRELEEEKGALAVSLEEANVKSTNQEIALRAYAEEIAGLKGLLESLRKRCSEAEERARAPKEVRERDDIIGNLEEEKRKLEDKLKWKKEQFQHLEEAHEKLRREYKQSKKEWEKEKSKFIDEICSLQSNLESQTRISADLEDRLNRCNQALIHEENRRRNLESQVSEYKAQLEDVFGECDGAKSRAETFNSERDRETADLRYTLGKKDSILKEMEYQTRKLELENQELMTSLRHLQEEKISHAGNSSSLSKLRNRLKNVEQMHRDSSANYKAKEAAWTTELAKLTTELIECRSELVDKEVSLEQIKKELESCRASLTHLMLLNEEITVMLLVMKSGMSEAKVKLADEVADLHTYYGRRDKQASYMIKQLEVKNNVLSKAYDEIVKEHEKVRNDVERCKGMLEESSRCQIYLREQVSQVETDANGKIREVRDALDRTGSELAEKISEANQIEFELHIWRSIAERLRLDMEENYKTRIELEASLLSQSEVEDMIRQENYGLLRQIEEKDKIIELLQDANVVLEREVKETESHRFNALISESSMPFEMERERLILALGEKDKIVEELQKEIGLLEQESQMKGIEGIVYANEMAEARFNAEKRDFMHLVEEKKQRVEDLVDALRSAEAKFINSLASATLKLAEKEAELDCFHEAFEKITAAEILAEVEIEEKKVMIEELEADLALLQKKLEVTESSLSLANERALEVESALDAKSSETKSLISRAEAKLASSDALIIELKDEKLRLCEDLMALLSEKESMEAVLGDTGEEIQRCSREDAELSAMLESIVRSIEGGSMPVVIERNNENVIPVGEGDPKLHEDDPPATKRTEVIVVDGGRPPFRVIN
ncbi:hypothetical protein MLD38_028766 [Melastoma candidum]|uniref:Uncharacterized protein n=1 Tax=Melastoma candidum TaxID=119954 RepID=A0ACB9N2U2_9MYRT|nr:hypothetical protein MLD38_028766 [Melastoma candidum]